MYTLTLNGNSSELSCEIFPSLEVKNNSQLCLVSLQTNNSIPNIEPGCNTITVHVFGGEAKTITIPTGSYELETIETVIQSLLPIEVSSFQLRGNKNTLKCIMTSSNNIDFSKSDSIAKLLGFRNVMYENNIVHESEELVKIMKVNCIKVECNLITGSFSNGYPSQAIHEFFPSVPAGFKIIEIPRHPVFYSINCSSISRINIVLVDQEDNLINLRGEPITVRLQIVHGYGS